MTHSDECRERIKAEMANNEDGKAGLEKEEQRKREGRAKEERR